MNRSCGNKKPMGMGMYPTNVSPASMGPSNMAPSGMYPSNVGPSNMYPSNVAPTAVSPAATGPMMPSTLPAIVTPPQTIVQNSYHPATQPIVHPINVVNQHHTIPIPEHFCAYSYSDVKCGMRASTKGVRRSSKKSNRPVSTRSRNSRKSR